MRKSKAIAATGLVTVFFAIACWTLLVNWAGAGKANHAAPYELGVAGQRTGVYSVAGLTGQDTPLSGTWTRAMDAIGVTTQESVTDQTDARRSAWRATRDYLGKDGDAPGMDGPLTWVGRSAGLAYALAFTLHELDTAASVQAGRKIAATGAINEFGGVSSVQLVPQKTAAALEAGAELFFIPKVGSEESRQAFSDSLELVRQANSSMSIVQVSSLSEAVRYLCHTAPGCTNEQLPHVGEQYSAQRYWKEFSLQWGKLDKVLGTASHGWARPGSDHGVGGAQTHGLSSKGAP